MQIIQTLSPVSQVSLYVLVGLMVLFSLLIFGWQIMVLRGKAMQNADGTTDDYNDQKTHYGIALADVFLACPACFVGMALVFIHPRWGFYLLSMVAFWFVWANTMTTATSLRFEKPRLTLNWWLTFPAEIFLGAAFIAWTVMHFDAVFL